MIYYYLGVLILFLALLFIVILIEFKLVDLTPLKADKREEYLNSDRNPYKGRHDPRTPTMIMKDMMKDRHD